MEKYVEEIIRLTFSRLGEAYEKHREREISHPLKHLEGESRLVFPCYGKHRRYKTRISEQELRFAFVEAFNIYCDEKELNLFYSVEVPTKGTYLGFADRNEEPRIAKDKEHGRSAEFDLVIYDENLNRICLVEFKALNANEHDHKKDFVKLNNIEEEGYLRYFIEIVKSANNGTYKNIHGKIQGNESFFRCYSLDEKSEITDYICRAQIDKKTKQKT